MYVCILYVSMYVCMYVCMYECVCMCVCLYVSRYVWVYRWLDLCECYVWMYEVGLCDLVADVAMIYFGRKENFWRLEWVVGGKSNVEEEDTAIVRTLSSKGIA